VAGRQTTNDLIVQLEAMLGIERDGRTHSTRILAIHNEIKALQRKIILLEYDKQLMDDKNLKQGKLPLKDGK